MGNVNFTVSNKNSGLFLTEMTNYRRGGGSTGRVGRQLPPDGQKIFA